jgi:hypothetical protein
MGKSVAAVALSAKTGAPCLDLARVKVGSGTLAGELGKFLGMAEAGTFLEDVRNGSSALIVDGIDEAQLQSGTEHFFAFMDDLAQQLVGATASLQVIVLGRPDSIAGAEAVLAERHVPYAVASLMPLDRDQAAALISNYLDKTQYDGHRANPVPFGELRDAVLEDIARALTGEERRSLSDLWERSSDFIGYPPVLEAIATRLQFSNPKAELERVRSHPTSFTRSRGQLLVQVAERILDRETDKVRDNLSNFSLSAADAASPLYTREEQIVRMLVRMGNLDLPVVPPASLSDHAKAVYEEHVGTFLADHPFLRDRAFSNVVFADYVRAFVATSPTIAGYGPSQAAMLSLCPEVGPFYAHFAHALSLTDGGSVISESTVDDVLRSFHVEDRKERFSTFAQRAGSARLALTYGGPLIDKGTAAAAPTDALVFHIDPTTLSGAIEITAPLARCVIATDSGLVLRSTSAICELGPDVIISAEIIDIRADRLLALGDSEDRLRGVLLAAQEIASSPRMRVGARPDDSLAVIGPAPLYPWSPYTLDFGKNGQDFTGQEVTEGIVYARRILTSFGKALGDAPARNMDFVDRIVVGNAPIGQRILDGMVSVGVVRREPPLYRLDLAALGSYGVNYAALRGPRFEETLGKLVKEILTTH